MAESRIARLGVLAKPQSPLAPQAVARVLKWGKKRGVEILMDRACAKTLKLKSGGLEHSKLFNSIDALVVLGGDGTFLGAAREATERAIPLLGVNLGSLGFMTEVALDGVETALEELSTGNYSIEERMMLDLKIKGRSGTRSDVALNEVVFSRKAMAKMIELSVSVNGQHITQYKADGLIISTPTGSTAYALSAGGPILYPTLDAILICPICPHTLTNRPVVIPGADVIEIDIMKGQEEVVATLDGQICLDLNPMDHLTLCRSSHTTRIIKVPERTHYDTLRDKLGWGGSATIGGNNG